jgi:hypothetical protein
MLLSVIVPGVIRDFLKRLQPQPTNEPRALNDVLGLVEAL